MSWATPTNFPFAPLLPFLSLLRPRLRSPPLLNPGFFLSWPTSFYMLTFPLQIRFLFPTHVTIQDPPPPLLLPKVPHFHLRPFLDQHNPASHSAHPRSSFHPDCFSLSCCQSRFPSCTFYLFDYYYQCAHIRMMCVGACAKAHM